MLANECSKVEELENHYVDIITLIFDSGTNLQWILKLEGEYLMRQDIYKVSKHLSIRNLLIMKGEIVTLWEKPGRYHLNQMIKANSLIMAQMDIMYLLRRTHHFCGIFTKMYNLTLIMKNYQTNQNGDTC